MNLLHAITSRPWAINTAAASAYVRVVERLLDGHTFWRPATDEAKREAAPKLWTRKSEAVYELRDTYDARFAGQLPPNSVVVVPIKGVVTQENQDCGPAGTDERRMLLESLAENDSVAGVVLEMTTPGGEVSGLQSFADTVAAFPKPIYTVVSGYAFSAGYYMASMTDGIFLASKADEVGSIGTMATLMDLDGVWRARGAKIEDIYATESTEKNAWYRAWKTGDNSGVQALLDETNAFFLETVQAGRPGIDPDALKGRTYIGQKAIDAGLADGIATLSEVVAMIGEAEVMVQEAANEPNPQNPQAMSINRNSLRAALKAGAAALLGGASTEEATEQPEETTAPSTPETAEASAEPEQPETTEQPEEVEEPAAEEQTAEAPAEEEATVEALERQTAVIRAHTEAINAMAAAQERLNAATQQGRSIGAAATLAGKGALSTRGKGDPAVAGPDVTPTKEAASPLDKAAAVLGRAALGHIDDTSDDIEDEND